MFQIDYKLSYGKLMAAVLLSVLVLASCKKPKADIPPDVINPDTMVQVMADVHIAEAAVTQKSAAGESGEKYAASFYLFAFKKHNITEEKYRSSVAYYSAHPDLYQNIYSQVITELSKRQAESMQKP